MPELTPQQKTQLDSNIRAMLEKGASQDDVIKYSQDFRSRFDVPVKKKVEAVSFPSARDLQKQYAPSSDNMLSGADKQAKQVATAKAADNIKFAQTELPKKKEAAKQAALAEKPSADKFNPVEYLKFDMEGDGKESIDRALLVSKNANALADANGIEQADLGEGTFTDVQKSAHKLKSYYQMRLEDFKTKESELKAKLQNAQQDKILNNPERGDMAIAKPIDLQGKAKAETPQTEKDIYDELAVLQDKKSKLTRSVDYFAKLYAKKIKPDANNKELAHEYGKLVGDEQLLQSERLQKKGIPITDEDKLNEEQIGLNIRAANLEEEYADIPLNERPDAYFENAFAINEANKNSINKFPELKQKRVAQRLVQELGKDAEQLLMMASGGDKEALKIIAEKTGLTQKDIRFIETGDLPSESLQGNIGKGIWNAGAGLLSGTHRILGTVLGEDTDRIDYINNKISESGNAVFGSNPYEQTQEAQSIIDKGLQEVANPRAGKYSYNAESIKNFVGNAIGNLAGFVGGTKGLGMLGMGERAALYTNIIVGGQEQRYQQANEIMGKDASEAGKNLFALVTGAIEGAAFEFMPKGAKEKLGISQSTSKEIANLVKAGSIESIDKEALKSTVQKAIEGIGKSAGEAAKVTLAMKGAGLANAIVSSLVAEKGKENVAYGEFSEGLEPNKIAEEFFGLMIPLGLMEIPHTAKSSRQFKEVLFDSGLRPNESKAVIGKLVDEKKMTEEEGEKRMKVIDVMSNIQKTLPDVNPTTGEKLNHNQQVEYAYNRVKELATQAKKEGVKGDAALGQFYDRNQKELVDERKSIIEGTHNEYLNRSEIFDRIKEKETHKAAINQGTKSEVVQYLAEQALTATDATKNGLKGDKELTIDLIAQNPPIEIKAEIKNIKEKHKKAAEKEDYDESERLDKTLELLQAGLEKTKKPELKVKIEVQDAIDYISKEMGGASWDKEKFRKEWEEKLKDKEDATESYKTKLRNQISELDKQIADKKRKPKDKADEKTYDEETTKLIEERDKKREELEKVAPLRESEEAVRKRIEKFITKLKGLTQREKDALILKTFNKIITDGALDYPELRKMIAEVTGRGEMTEAEASRLRELVKQTNLVDEAGKRAREERTPESLKAFRKAEDAAGEATRELNTLLYNRPNITKRLTSIMQLNTLGLAALVNNLVYNVVNQTALRFPVGVVNTAIDLGISGAAKATGKKYNAETAIYRTQAEFFKKLGFGIKESFYQLFSGLNRQDYLQKEIHGQQIRPVTAWEDIWAFAKKKKNLTGRQIVDKGLQGTFGVPAEIVARTLNLGDKPQRFAAEGSQAAAFAKALGLKGMDYNLFIEFPREEAYMQYKKQGLSDAEAGKKADYVRDTIVKEGQRSTFQQDNMLNDMLNKLFGGEQSGVGSLAKAVVISPYIKIPANAYWSYYNLVNPEVAMLQSMMYGAKAAAKKYGGYKRFMGDKENTSAAKDLHEARYWLAHGVVGMATRAVITSLVAAGVFRSNNSDDDTKKEREGEAFYEQQGSINVSKLKAYLKGENPDDVKNGLVVQNRWFGHWGSVGNTIAKRNEEMTPEQKEAGETYWNEVLGNLELSSLKELEQGVFGNTSSLLTALNRGGEWLAHWGVNTMGMFTNIIQPATFAQISRAQLPYYSKNKADNFLGELKNSMLARSSWLRKFADEMPPSKIGIWGDVLDKKDNVPMRLFGISKANDDNFAQAIYEDAKKTNNIKFLPSSVKPEIKVGDKTIKLNTKQAEELEILVGQQRKQLVAPYVNDMAVFDGSDKKYSQLSNEEKTDKLQILYDAGFQNGKDLFLLAHPEYKANEPTEDEKGMKKQKENENEILRKQSSNKSASW